MSLTISPTTFVPRPRLMRRTKFWREREREAQALCQVRWQGLDDGHNCGMQYSLYLAWHVVIIFISSARSEWVPTEQCAQIAKDTARNYVKRTGTCPLSRVESSVYIIE